MSSKQPLRVPKYRHYKPKNLGVVRLNGQDHYLGPYDSPESWQKYHRLIAEWLECPDQPRPASLSGESSFIGISTLVEAYLAYARTYYSRNGKPTKEYVCMVHALRPLLDVYGLTNALEFGPKALKTLREEMIRRDWCRQLINNRVNRIRRFFRWAVSEELLPPSVYEALRTVPGLRFGKTSARESLPVRPVDLQHVEAVLPHVSPQVAAMIQVQLLAGMRPGEVTMMRPCDIDRSGEIWLYEPAEHKNQWRGHRRIIPLGPKAQAILRPFLQRAETTYLFSPKEAEADRNAKRRAARKTPLTPSQSRRKPKTRSKRPKRERYDTHSYCQAVEYGIRKANADRDDDDQVEHWTPLRLRHSRATEVRRDYGLDGAQSTLGHARADITEIYAEKNLELAMRIARETG